MTAQESWDKIMAQLGESYIKLDIILEEIAKLKKQASEIGRG